MTEAPGPFAGEVEVAVVAAREAGAAAMAHYGAVEAVRKAGGSPVTAADHAANDAILERLGRAFPADAILSEESRDSAARLEQARVWIVDPLDGTKEFLAQNGEFAIMVGLAVDGAAVAGALYLPARDVLYRAAAGSGAWGAHADGGWSRLAPGPAAERLRLVGSRSHSDPFVARLARRLGTDDLLASGSVGVKCSLIASGARDLYVHPVAHLHEWDTCAPEVLVREAGGIVLDCLGTPLRYNKETPIQPHGIFACGPGAERALPVVTELYESRRRARAAGAS